MSNPDAPLDLQNVISTRTSSPSEIVSETTSTSSIEVIRTSPAAAPRMMADAATDGSKGAPGGGSGSGSGSGGGGSTPAKYLEPNPLDPYNKCNVVLDRDGKKWMPYVTQLPVFMKAFPDILRILRGDYVEPPKTAPEAERQRYELANDKGKRMLFQSMSDELSYELFYGDSENHLRSSIIRL